MCVLAVLAACRSPDRPPPSGSQPFHVGQDPQAVATVVTASTPGPAAPGTAATVTASCPVGSVVMGGGVSTALAGGGKPPSSLHANGTVPVAGGWHADGATGGQPVLAGETTSFALCVAGGPGRVQIVRAAVAGPGAARTLAAATAQCPAGSLLIGGGGFTGTPTGQPGSPSLHLLGTFPSDSVGNPVLSGEASAWTAQAGAGGRQAGGLETSAYALCSAWPGHQTVVASASRPGPLGPGTDQAVMVGCPSGWALLNGGGLTGQSGGGAPQQGLHLTGSYPSDGAGRPLAAAAHRGFVWGARAEAGGQGSPPGTITSAFAMCLRP